MNEELYANGVLFLFFFLHTHSLGFCINTETSDERFLAGRIRSFTSVTGDGLGSNPGTDIAVIKFSRTWSLVLVNIMH